MHVVSCLLLGAFKLLRQVDGLVAFQVLLRQSVLLPGLLLLLLLVLGLEQEGLMIQSLDQYILHTVDMRLVYFLEEVLDVREDDGLLSVVSLLMELLQLPDVLDDLMIISVDFFISLTFLYFFYSHALLFNAFKQLNTPGILFTLLPAHSFKNETYDMKHVSVYRFVELSQPFENP